MNHEETREALIFSKFGWRIGGEMIIICKSLGGQSDVTIERLFVVRISFRSGGQNWKFCKGNERRKYIINKISGREEKAKDIGSKRE